MPKNNENFKINRITKASAISEDEPDVNSEYNIYYTSDAIKPPFENKQRMPDTF